MQAKKATLSSWGNHQHSECAIFRPERMEQVYELLQQPSLTILAHGNRLNYGDQAFNTNGYILQTNRLDRVLSFDENTGILVCEPGVTFKDLLLTFLPRGWISPVLPGTLNASIGGAVANDVHGKNDHIYGSFGQCVLALELVTPAGIQCLTAEQNEDLFFATIGGLGLTGIISKITLQLVRTHSETVEVTTKRIKHVESWLEAFAELNADFFAGWMDLSKVGVASTRGLLWTAHFSLEEKKKANIRQYKALPIPLMNSMTLRWFNRLYFHQIFKQKEKQYKHLMDFINPLDKIKSWNKWYGRDGFYQLQFVLPKNAALSGLKEIIALIKQKNVEPGLAVIKQFSRKGRGLLSFTSPGITLAMDFHNRPHHKKIIAEITAIVNAHSGKIYLAKDALLDRTTFQNMYPEHDNFRKIREQYGLSGVFCSDLSRRLGI